MGFYQGYWRLYIRGDEMHSDGADGAQEKSPDYTFCSLLRRDALGERPLTKEVSKQ